MYKEYHPSPLLSPYIDKYWEFKGQPEYGMHINILPDGCTDFIFTLGEAPKAVHDNLVVQPHHVYFIGTMTTYSELVTHTVTVHMLGIHFLPCGILRFMDLPLQELTNLRLNADELTSLFNHSQVRRSHNSMVGNRQRQSQNKRVHSQSESRFVLPRKREQRSSHR